MPTLGADTDQLREMGTRMRGSVLELQQRQMEISRAVAVVDWEGPDAEDFRGRVMSEVTPNLQVAQESLQRMSEEILEHASEQDDASDPRGFWEKLNDLLHIPSQITRTIRNLQKIITNIPEMLKLFRTGMLGMQQVRDLRHLAQRFPAIAAQELKAVRKEMLKALSPDGWSQLGGKLHQAIRSGLGINLPGTEWLDKAFSPLDKSAKPWVKAAGKGLGKLLPGLDIGLGVHQLATGDAYDKVSGGLSVASGALVLAAPLAGPAAPIVAGVGVGLGVVSAGMDIGRTAYENIPAVKNAVDGTVNVVKEGASKIGEGLSAIGDGFASMFG